MRAFMLLLLIAVGVSRIRSACGPGSRLAPDPIPFSAFARYVRAPAGQMPPYTGKVLSDTELADIHAFLESIPQPPAVDSIPALRDDC